MHVLHTTPGLPKPAAYAELLVQLESLIADEPDALANTANMAAMLFEALPDINWAGFYFLRGGELVLGPFQGKIACVRIALGRGVCGTAAAERRTIVVPDVNEFPGHIFCDAASRSEVVVPMVKDGQLLGVLDVDSPSVARFDDEDANGLERMVQALVGRSGWEWLAHET